LYPFDKLVDELQIRRDVSRNPLFDVQVIVQNEETGNKSVEQHSAINCKWIYRGKKNDQCFDMVLVFPGMITGQGTDYMEQ